MSVNYVIAGVEKNDNKAIGQAISNSSRALNQFVIGVLKDINKDIGQQKSNSSHDFKKQADFFEGGDSEWNKIIVIPMKMFAHFGL
jgi:hypothetical protein